MELNKYSCRICFDEFENRNEVICPCKCDGSMKYICKTCMKTCLDMEDTTKNNIQCGICKNNYVRKVPNVYQKINSEVRDEVLFGIGVVSTLFTSLIYISNINFLFIFILIIVYFISLLTIIKYQSYSEYSFYILLFLYLSVIFTPMYIGKKILILWILALMIKISYHLINDVWDNLYLVKYNKIVKNLKCNIFDFDLNKFISNIF